MKHWQQLNIDDRRAAIEIASARKRLPQLAIEKDWWVTMILKALSLTKHFPLMSFKGGTSLSKAWNLINRFSEDIDIAIRREEDFSISAPTGNQLAKVRRATRHYIVKELPIELESIMKKMGLHDFAIEPETRRTDVYGNTFELRPTTHPSTIFINYESVLTEVPEYITPRVKIEMSCLSMDEPVELKTIRSFISEVLKEDENIEVAFPSVVPTRTFLEKIFLLHEEFQKLEPRSMRMSRHLYDIEKIMDTPFGEAIKDKELYNAVVNHRSTFNKIDGVDYSRHATETLSCIPPQNFLSEWEKDYVSMQKNFIFEQNSLPFSSLLDRIKQLMDRIKNY